MLTRPKLHDRISDMLKIREKFDLNYILKNYCRKLKVKLDETETERIVKNRDCLMRKSFYRFASSTEGKEKIDRHYIIMAIDQWMWFWIMAESILFLVIALIILASNKLILASIILLMIIIVELLLMKYSYRKSIDNANIEIDLILEDEERVKEVERAFNEVLSR